MFCFFLSLIILSGCVKDNPSHTKQEVENYIRQLRQGTYKKLDMPEFSQEAIPYLLTYRNEEDFISNFPRNPISSYLLKKCRLGIYVLWTVESIRAGANESPYLIMRFPSLNPILFNKTSPDIDEAENHKNAALAYQQWWYQHYPKQFDTYKHLDPLSTTDLSWK